MKTMVMGVAMATMAVAVTTALGAHAEFRVEKGPDSCANAHAVIVASASGKHDYIWGEIGEVVKSKPDRWQVVDDHEPGVWGKVSFRQYALKGREGATAYVAHCGHGGTCNALVEAFFEAHDDWYSPEVFCGSVPEFLESPERVSF